MTVDHNGLDSEKDPNPSQAIEQILETVNTIALVGASDKPHRASYQVMQFLLEQGYEVIPVNPKLAGQSLLQQHCHAQLADIQRPVDMVDIFRSSDAALAITRQAIAIKAKVVWMQLGVINNEAAQIARAAGLQLVMNRCPKIELMEGKNNDANTTNNP